MCNQNLLLLECPSFLNCITSFFLQAFHPPAYSTHFPANFSDTKSYCFHLAESEICIALDLDSNAICTHCKEFPTSAASQLTPPLINEFYCVGLAFTICNLFISKSWWSWISAFNLYKKKSLIHVLASWNADLQPTPAKPLGQVNPSPCNYHIFNL